MRNCARRTGFNPIACDFIFVWFHFIFYRSRAAAAFLLCWKERKEGLAAIQQRVASMLLFLLLPQKRGIAHWLMQLTDECVNRW